MTTTNKFFPAGVRNVTSTFRTCNSKLLCCKKQKDDMKEHLHHNMDDPRVVKELWEKMGSPSATIFMCGYKIHNGEVCG